MIMTVVPGAQTMVSRSAKKLVAVGVGTPWITMRVAVDVRVGPRVAVAGTVVLVGVRVAVGVMVAVAVGSGGAARCVVAEGGGYAVFACAVLVLLLFTVLAVAVRKQLSRTGPGVG